MEKPHVSLRLRLPSHLFSFLILIIILYCSLCSLPLVAGQCDGTVLELVEPAGYFSSDGTVTIPLFPTTGTYTLDDIVPRAADSASNPFDYVPPPLGANVVCRWLIKPNYRIDPESRSEAYHGPVRSAFVLFHALSLQTGGSIAFYEGEDTTGLLLNTTVGPFSGLPPQPVATVNDIANITMYIELNSGPSSGSYFDAYWQAGGCMFGIAVLSAQNSYFTDGSGPWVPYGLLSYCGFILYSDDTSSVIRISASGYVESSFDWLYFYDGPTPGDNLLVGLTSNFSSGAVESSSNVMFVLFSSDKFLVYDGFRVDYEVIDNSTCSGLTEITSLAGKITDGSGNLNYIANRNCQWRIDASHGNYIALYFSDIDLADDFLRVYAGNDSTGRLIKTFTGKMKYSTLVHDGPENLFIVFTSDAANFGQGFSATYHAGKCVSNVILTENSGIINDGSGIGTYSSNSVCLWTVQLDPSLVSHIEIDPVSFDTEYRFDYITINDGTGSQLLDLSGINSTFDTLSTTGASMTILFSADTDNVRDGWEIQYNAVFIPPPNDETPLYRDPGSALFLILLMGTALLCLVLFVFYCVILLCALITPIFDAFLAGFVQTGIWFNLYIIAICGLTCFTFYPFIGQPTDGLCTWRIWTLEALFALIVPLVCKCYWLYIANWLRPKENRKTVLRPKYGPWVAFWFVAILIFILAIETVFLIIWTAVDRPLPEKMDSLTGDNYYYACESKHHGIWIGIQAGMVGVVVLLGVIASFLVFPLSTAYYDGRSTGLCFMLMSVGITIFAVALFLLRDEPQAWIALLGLGIWIGVLAPLVLLIIYRLCSALRPLVRPGKESEGVISAKQVDAALNTGPDDFLDAL